MFDLGIYTEIAKQIRSPRDFLSFILSSKTIYKASNHHLFLLQIRNDYLKSPYDSVLRNHISWVSHNDLLEWYPSGIYKLRTMTIGKCHKNHTREDIFYVWLPFHKELLEKVQYLT